jgi:hypothetical protein
MSSYNLFSQDSVYYVILTSQKLKGEYYNESGIFRSTTKKQLETQKSPSIFFDIVSPDKKIHETFFHADYDVKKLKAERGKHGSDPTVDPDEIMDIKVLPIAFLDTIIPIDLDKEFPTMTYESARARLEPLRGKRIYVIDRNDIKNGKVKLIGVKYITSRSSLPAELLNY